MNVYGNKITCDTELTQILDSRVFLTSNPDTVPGNLCKNINNYLASKIETLHSLSDGNDSLMATAFLIDNKPQELNKARSTVTNYENDSILFKNTFNDIGLKIVEREISELKELLYCLDEKLAMTKTEDSDYTKYKNKMVEVEGRLAKVRSTYGNLQGSNISYQEGSIFAEAKKTVADGKEVLKSDYVELVYTDWSKALPLITGKSLDDLYIDAHDRVVFNNALEAMQKHFKAKADKGETIYPIDVTNYWENIKQGKLDEFYDENDFGEEEIERIKEVEKNLTNIGKNENGYGFHFDAVLWARYNGIEMNKSGFNEWIDSEKTNKNPYYKREMEELKYD